MGRVPWAALGGDEVETVLANLIYNWKDRAVRIRPDQGDGGIDVLVPAETVPETWDIYQVKKFAVNLGASQKTQIDKSFRRVLLTLVRRGVPLRNWYLVTPLDPTLSNFMDWFHTVPTRAVETLTSDTKLALTEEEMRQIRAWIDAPSRIIDWKGAPFCETLVADYPRVVDYYLEGGRERLRDAVADLSKMLQTDHDLQALDREAGIPPGHGSVALLDPGRLTGHLERLSRVLDTDPHFRYGIALDIRCPNLAPEPGLVAAAQRNLPDGQWLTTKIYARSAQSLQERPIPLEVKFTFDTPEDREALDAWLTYGKPIEMAATIAADLPGGLAINGGVGRVTLMPAAGEHTEFHSRQRIVDPTGVVLAELGLTTSCATGTEGHGMWHHSTDDSGTLTEELRIPADPNGIPRAKFTLTTLAGRRASAVVDAVRFANHLTAPNHLHIASEFGPFYDFAALATHERLADPTLAQFVEDLVILQALTPVPIIVPDDSELTVTVASTIRRAAALVGGHTMVGTWQPFTLEMDAGGEIDPDRHYMFALLEPLVVPLNGQDMVLGCVKHVRPSARIESVRGGEVQVGPHLNDTQHSSFVLETTALTPGQQRVLVQEVPGQD